MRQQALRQAVAQVLGGVEQRYIVNNGPATENALNRATPQRGHVHQSDVTRAKGLFTPPEPAKQSLFGEQTKPTA